ncbi:MAG TPA: NADH-quinone oxidoreductase subunit J [Dehalococcoidia bacterium]|nr:NADH-quinone oxidoreductase subunit J [Dehalococcoidia bacterium]
MDDTGTVIAFWILAAITVGAALMVVMVRNLIRAVIFLILSFVGVAGLYITLSADFVAVTQILIYAGAVSVLMLFAIVLTPRGDRGNQETFLRLPALLLALLVAFTLGYVAIDTEWAISDREGFEETASVIGEALLDKYVLPFEIASVLLLVAMLGAIVIVRPESGVDEARE